jgi:hypothetical protein
MKTKLLLLLVALGANLANVALADVVRHRAKVVAVLHSADSRFGGCMARLDTSPSDSGSSCRAWATFSCTGDFTSKDNAYRMFDMSQMAFSLGKDVEMDLNDSRTHNGYCFVERMTVF